MTTKTQREALEVLPELREMSPDVRLKQLFAVLYQLPLSASVNS